MANNKVKFLRGTAAEYQALTVKDPDTLYVITDESENSDIINDTLISQTTTWSSQKIHDSLNTSSAPTAFSIETSAFTTLSTAFAGCGYAAEINADGVTSADFPDVYFNENSLENAAAASIIAATSDGKIMLYAKKIPAAAISGAYFIRKGATS